MNPCCSVVSYTVMKVLWMWSLIFSLKIPHCTNLMPFFLASTTHLSECCCSFCDLKCNSKTSTHSFSFITVSQIKYSFFYLFIFWPHLAVCRILVPWPAIELQALVVRAPSPNHWAAREFLGIFFSLCLLSWKLSPFHWKDTFYSFSLAYLNCPHHYSYTLSHY